MLYPAMDLGGMKIAGALGHADGSLVSQQTIPAEAEAEGGLDHVIALIVSLLRQFAGSPTALGIGVPGLAGRSSGDIKFLPTLATQWRGALRLRPKRRPRGYFGRMRVRPFRPAPAEAAAVLKLSPAKPP